MKAIITTVITSYVLVFWIGPFIGSVIFPYGGVEESYLIPIYIGIIFLSGLIVGCTVYLAGLLEKRK